MNMICANSTSTGGKQGAMRDFGYPAFRGDAPGAGVDFDTKTGSF